MEQLSERDEVIKSMLIDIRELLKYINICKCTVEDGVRHQCSVCAIEEKYGKIS